MHVSCCFQESCLVAWVLLFPEWLCLCSELCHFLGNLSKFECWLRPGLVAEFDAERRAFNKLELKRIRQQQAQDRVEPDLMSKLEAKDGSLSGSV